MNEEAAATGCQDRRQEQCYGYGQQLPPTNSLPSMSTTRREFTTMADERIFCSRGNHFYSRSKDIAPDGSQPDSPSSQ
jgi:hypothetical protein